MSTKKFLLDDNQSNILRLVHYTVKCGKNNVFNLKMHALSIFTLYYNIMVAMATILDIFKAYELVFKEFGLIVMMNYVIIIVIPLALSYFGFILILCEKDYISAVLNCLTLLCIPEIDN